MSANTSNCNDKLLEQLGAWVSKVVGRDAKLEPLLGDASSKSFYRVVGNGKPILALHAPCPENVVRYRHAQELLHRAGLRVPELLATDEDRNFALVEDLGNNLFLDTITACPERREELYQAAWENNNRLQLLDAGSSGLAAYDNTLLDTELGLFPEWYAKQHRHAPLTDTETNDYARICQLLKDNFTAQPQAITHRDFHSRNLFAGPGQLAVIDFAGALVGPHTYDIASLLRDLYTEIDDETQLDWLVRQWEHARSLGLPVATDFSNHYLRFELTSLQRLVKVLGLFVRLHLRDGKKSYLAHLPRCEQLVHAIALRYRDLRPLALMVEARSA